jgi:tetratricopeptide (TPR) repeat protein
VEELQRALESQPSSDEQFRIRLERAATYRSWAAGKTASEIPMALKLLDSAIQDYTFLLEKKPEDRDARRSRAETYQECGQRSLTLKQDPPLDAIDFFRNAVTDAPDLSDAAVRLQEFETEHTTLAQPHLDKARELERDGQSADARKSADEEYRSAIAHLKVALQASHAKTATAAVNYYNRGFARLGLADPDYSGCVADLEEFVALDRELTESNWDGLLEDRANHRAGALSKLAWILATCPVDTLRNGEKSRRYAEEAYKIFAAKYEKSPTDDTLFANYVSALTALAAAHAETGDFDAAIKRTEEILGLFDQGEDKAAIENQRMLLDQFYRRGRPFRDEKRPSKAGGTR